jgi:hypothetical protein
MSLTLTLDLDIKYCVLTDAARVRRRAGEILCAFALSHRQRPNTEYALDPVRTLDRASEAQAGRRLHSHDYSYM